MHYSPWSQGNYAHTNHHLKGLFPENHIDILALLLCDLYLILIMMAAGLGVSVFTKLAGVPSLTGARIIPGGAKTPTEIEARSCIITRHITLLLSGCYAANTYTHFNNYCNNSVCAAHFYKLCICTS